MDDPPPSREIFFSPVTVTVVSHSKAYTFFINGSRCHLSLALHLEIYLSGDLGVGLRPRHILFNLLIDAHCIPKNEHGMEYGKLEVLARVESQTSS